jgi:hypothetical protein
MPISPKGGRCPFHLGRLRSEESHGVEWHSPSAGQAGVRLTAVGW